MTYKRLRSYQEWELAAGHSQNTRDDRFELLQRAEHEIGELTRATEKQITRWLANPAWSTSTRATYWGHLHSYLVWALKTGLIDKDPMLNLPAGISHAFGTRMRALGLPRPLGLHMFRHLYGTSLLRGREHGGAGANLRVTQELMRHASPATTAVYTQVTDEERRRAVLSLAA